MCKWLHASVVIQNLTGMVWVLKSSAFQVRWTRVRKLGWPRPVNEIWKGDLLWSLAPARPWLEKWTEWTLIWMGLIMMVVYLREQSSRITAFRNQYGFSLVIVEGSVVPFCWNQRMYLQCANDVGLPLVTSQGGLLYCKVFIFIFDPTLTFNDHVSMTIVMYVKISSQKSSWICFNAFVFSKIL